MSLCPVVKEQEKQQELQSSDFQQNQCAYVRKSFPSPAPVEGYALNLKARSHE